MSRQAAGQRQALHAELEQAARDRIHMRGGKAQDLDRRRIIARRMVGNERRKRAEVARRCVLGPVHDGMRVALVMGEHGAQQLGPCDPSVMRREHAAHDLASDPGTAALVGDLRTPSADAMLPAAQYRPADRAGADDDDPAVGAVVRADAGRMRIRRQDDLAERLAPLPRRRELGGLGRTRQRQAGGDPRQIVRRELRLREAGERGLAHRREGLRQPQPDIGRAAPCLAKPCPRGIAQPGPAAGSAAVNAEEQPVNLHHG
jgi:hypothetical protein